MSFVGKIKYCTLEPYVLEQYWNRMQQFIVWCIVANALLLLHCHKPCHMIILFPFLKKVLRRFYLWRSKGRNAFNKMKSFTIKTAYWKTYLNKTILNFMTNCKSKILRLIHCILINFSILRLWSQDVNNYKYVHFYVEAYQETRWFYALFVKINLEYPITYAFVNIKERKITRMTFPFNAS